MNNILAQKSIRAALAGDWDKAIEFNTHILQDNPNDVDALNRLARAYSAVGEVEAAVSTSEKALQVEPNNSIAAKCLQKWKNSDNEPQNSAKPVSPTEFIEIPGKTKLIPLINVGDDTVVAQLGSADEVKLKAHNHRVCVYSTNDKYIGRLPDDIAAKLRLLLEHGNEYSVHIKTIKDNSIKIFVKETKRVKALENIPSFSSQKVEYLSFENKQSTK